MFRKGFDREPLQGIRSRLSWLIPSARSIEKDEDMIMLT